MLIFCMAAQALAGAGSGTASIAPSDDVTAGSTGTWTIEYVAAERFDIGTLELVIPAGWSPPQSADDAAEGYVTVTSSGWLAGVPLSIVGTVITVHIDSLNTDSTVSIVYGDDTIDPAGRAIAQEGAGTGVEFVVRSDPAGSAPADIASSPSLDVVAGPITQLVFVTPPRSFDAGGESGVMRVQARDVHDNPAAVTSDQDIDLTSTSGSGSFVPGTPVTMTAGTDTVSFYYSDTAAGTYTITAEAAGQGWTPAEQPVTVNAADPTTLAVAPSDTSAVAGEYTRFTVTTQDVYGNPSPLPAEQTITLFPDIGAFYDTDNHAVPIASFAIAAGETTTEVDYRNDTAKDAPGYLLGFWDNDGVPPSLGFTPASITIDHASPDTTTSTVDIDKTTAVADSNDFITVTVTVLDTYGNPVDNIGVELVVSGSPDSNFVSPSGSQDSDVDGTAVFELRSIRADSKTVQARIDGVLKTDGETVTFTAGDSYAPASEIAAVPDMLTVSGGAETSTVTVIVRDLYDNLVEGSTVVLNVTGSNNSYLPDPPIRFSDENGEASFAVWSIKAETKQATATIDDNPMSYSVPIVFTAGEADTGQSTIIASPLTATANGTDPVGVTVTVFDLYGNPVDNASVTLAVSGTGYSVNPSGIITGDDGEALFTVRSTKAEEKYIQAVIDTVTKPSGVRVTFEPGEPDPVASEITATLSPAVANGVDSVLVDVVVRDADGNAVEGSFVALQVSPSSRIDIKPSSARVTDENGTASFSVRSTATGWKTVNVEVDYELWPNEEQIEFIADEVDEILVTHDGAATAGVPDTVGIELRDAYGNLVRWFDDVVMLYTSTLIKQDNVTWGLYSGAGSIVYASGDTVLYDFHPGDEGTATLTITACNAEPLTIFAEYGAVSGQSVTPLVVSSTGPDRISVVSGDGQTSVVGTAVPYPLVVYVEDSCGNAVSGTTVTFTVINGGGSVDTDPGTPGLQSETTTNPIGIATCPVWILGTSSGVGNNEVTAEIPMGSDTVVTFTASATHGSLASVVITPETANVTVGGSRDVTAALTDNFGNPVVGEPLTIFIKDVPADGSLANNPDHPTTEINAITRAGQSDDEGKIYVRYVAPASAGLQDTVSAYHASLPADSIHDGVYTSSAGGATKLLATVLYGATSTAGEVFSFKVEAVDDNDNIDTSDTSHIVLAPPVGGGFTFSLDPGFSATTTEADLVAGTVTMYGRGENEGLWPVGVTATSPEPPLEGTSFSITIIPQDTVDHFAITTPAGNVTANANFSFSVEARDTYNNKVTEADYEVLFRAVDAVDTALAAPGSLSIDRGTLVDGFFSNSAVRYDKAGQIRIEVKDTVAAIVQCSDPITVVNSAAYQLVKLTEDPTGVAAGDSVLLQVRVEDQSENPVFNERVVFTRRAGGGSPDFAERFSDSGGVAELWYTTGPLVGTDTVRAAILDGVPDWRETRTFSITTVPRSDIAYVTLTLSGDKSYEAGEEFTGDIEAFDFNGNPLVSDSATQLEPIDENGSMVFVPPVVQLDAGTASFTVSDTVKGTNRIAIKRAIAPDTILSLPEWTDVTIDNAAADTILKVSGDETPIFAGGNVELVAAVEDRYGNGVDDEFVVFQITGDLGESLIPENGFVFTDANGEAACTLITDATAGINTVTASIQAGDQVTFDVQTIAGGISSYSVTPEGLEHQAGEWFVVNIVGYDEYGNPAIDDYTTVVELGSTSGTTEFSETLDTLVAGSIQVLARDTTAGLFQISAQTQGSGLPFYSEFIEIHPGPPGGTIQFQSVNPPTVTANGISTSLVTTKPVTDEYGNVVETGSLITVTTSIGEVASEDADPSSPDTVERATGPTGVVTASVLSEEVGAATVHFESVEATASGDTFVVFAPKPSIVYDDYISPRVIVPDDIVQFRCGVRNESSTGVSLYGSQSTISFGDSPNRYIAQLGSNDTIQGGATDTLVFSAAAVPSGIPGGSYTPLVSITGKDEYNASYATSFNTAANAVTVSIIEITNITVQPKIVSRGGLFEVRVKVRNKGGSSVYVNNIDVRMSSGIDFVQPSGWNPALPSELISGAELEFSGDVQIDQGSSTGESVVSATAFAEIAGTTVSDESGPSENDTILVQYEAAISHMPGSLEPAVVTRGERYAFSIDFRNDGDASVILDGSETNLSFTDGSETFIVSLGSTRALPGNGTVTTLTFDSAEVPGGFTSGNYPVSVLLDGTENGGQFVDAPVISDQVTVQTPPAIQFVDGTLYPKQVSKQSDVAFRLDLFNAGEATVLCNPDSTWLAFDSFRAFLNADQGDTIGPDTSSLYFESTTIPGSMPDSVYVPSLQIIGTANGIRFDTVQALTDTVTVQEPSGLVINSVSVTAPSNRITADQAQPRLLLIALKNGEAGDATVRFDSYVVRFFKDTINVTSQYQLNLLNFTLEEDSLLFGGEEDTLLVALSDNPNNDMSTGTILIEVEIRGTDENSGTKVVANTDFGQTGILVVQSRAEPVVLSVIPSVDHVTAGQDSNWTVDVAIHNEGQSDIMLFLDPDSTHLNFSIGSDFTVISPDALQGGGAVLEGGTTDTLHYVIDRTDIVTGFCTIDVRVAGVEINSGRWVLASSSTGAPDSVDIQEPAILAIVDLVPSQSTVTRQQPSPWTIDMVVENTGGSDVTIDSTGVEIPEAITAFTIVNPPLGMQLGGGKKDTLTFNVTTTGDIDPGKRVIKGAVRGIEDNSGRIIRAVRADSDSVTFQNRPVPKYVSGSLTPHIGSRGTEVSIRLSIGSEDSTEATLILDEDRTKVSFNDGQRFYEALLADFSEKELVGRDTTAIQFRSTNIPTDIDTGLYTVQIQLEGTENGNDFVLPSMNSSPDAIKIVPLPELSITSLVTPESVTRSIQPEWPVQMLVQNSGEASLAVDFDSTMTRITFEIVGEGDVTDGYTIEYPDHLEKSGSNVLPGNDEDTLVFLITKTDSTTGIARVDGYVTARDINDPQSVWSDDTKTNGGRYISIQEPGEPVILHTEASRSTVTSGQEAPWTVTLTVKNEGEAALTLVPDSTYIYYDGDSRFSVPDPPQAFEEAGDEGDTTLIEGETKHLVFTVAPTPVIPDGAVLDIKARVGMIEDNRGAFLAYDTDTDPGARTTITVQKPADLRIASLRSGAHNGTFVNHDQGFPLLVEILNTGGAEVGDIKVELDNDGESIIENSVITISSLAGSSGTIDTFLVEAASNTGTDTFVARLLSAVDANSDSLGTPDDPGIIFFSEPLDSIETMTIQEPGLLQVLTVQPSQLNVNKGQTTPWTITVRVCNDGQAPVTLAEPQAGDVGFYQDITKQRDYIVEPPGGFDSGAPDLTLGEGEEDLLVYEVIRTGLATGTITIRATLKWQDENDPGRGVMQEQSDASIVVNEPSGVRVSSVWSFAPNADNLHHTSIVNTGQEFNLRVTVSNTGDDNLIEVAVALVSSEGLSTISMSDSTPDIPSNSDGYFMFVVKALGSPGDETLTASITNAKSETTGEDVDIFQGEDSFENLIIQTPAVLSCIATVTAPPGAVDGTVSVGQIFTVTASVLKTGDANIDGTGTITLTLPDSFALDPPEPQQDLTRPFQTPGEEISWTIRAPDAAQDGPDTVFVSIETIPKDVNIDSPAAVAEGEARIVLVTEDAAAVTGCVLDIVQPEGAPNDVLSTGQEFVVEASVTPSNNAGGVWVLLSAPGFIIDGDATRNIGDGDGQPDTVRWNVTAPVIAGSESLGITSGGFDRNIDEAATFEGCSFTLPVEIVEKALLNLSARITGPEAALDSVIPVDFLFTIGATVINKGAAGVDTTGALLEIVLPEGLGYSLEGQDDRRPFYPDETYEWSVRSPNAPTGPGNIVVRFAGPPAQPAKDVNTGAAAAVDTGSVSIPIQTEAGEVSMLNTSEEGVTPPYVVPQGARNIPALDVSVTNNTTSTVGLDTIYVSITDANGTPRSPASRWIEAVILETESGAYRAETVSSRVPVIIPHETITGGGTDAYTILVDIAAGAPAGDVRINLARSGDVVFSVGGTASDQRVGVVWGGPDGIWDNHFMSGPLSVMSGNFAEYAHNYPNPFRAGSESTRISYFLTQDASVRIDIYDLTGTHVWAKDVAAGEPGGTGAACEVEWDGRNMNGEVVRNGVYICRIQAGSKSATFKIAVAK